MVVVVAEHREDRHVEIPAGHGDHLGLLRLSARGQVAGQEDDVGFAIEVRERALDAIGAHVGRMDVGGCSDPYHCRSCC